MYQTIVGFGADLSVLEKTDLDFSGLRENFPRYAKAEYEEYLADEGKPDDDDSLYEFLTEYETSNGTFGLAAFLSEAIKIQERVGVECFDETNNGILYVPRLFPFKFNEKEKGMTEKDWVSLISKYVGYVTKAELPVDEIEMYVS